MTSPNTPTSLTLAPLEDLPDPLPVLLEVVLEADPLVTLLSLPVSAAKPIAVGLYRKTEYTFLRNDAPTIHWIGELPLLSPSSVLFPTLVFLVLIDDCRVETGYVADEKPLTGSSGRWHPCTCWCPE
jgi:hypothetical protein